MSPQDASTLMRDDVIWYQSQTYRFTATTGNGYLLMLRGQHGNCIVPAARCPLVYRAGEVPAGFAVGPLNAEEAANIIAVIEERLRREREGEGEPQ
jgi:hypothetical protein